jgi:ABC-2 type transport system ATP-binding protein
MIEVNNIVKQYGSHLAVDHLSFRVEKGQIYGFLGPNGAGKSTTMNIITGYLASNEGTVVINGHDILEEPEEAKKCIGYLPEIPPLYQDMTVMEYLHFVAGLKGVQKSEEEEILTDIIEKTYLESVKDRLIKNLSKGYKQRVGLAQALVGNPEILILDEPTVGLDPKQIIEIRSLIKELAQDHTVILSSHILSEVSAICDQIMIISHGKLVACDTPDNLSRSVEGTTTLKLSILDKDNKAMQLMQEHFGDSAVINEISEETDSQDSQIWQGTIETEGDKDIREELFYLLADAKCPLLEMTQTKLSLEDIFLELTEDDTTEKEEA